MPSTGAIFSEVTFFTPPFVPTVTAANEGLSLSGTIAQLGQAVGAAGNPALVTTDREIPIDGFSFINLITNLVPRAQLELSLSALVIDWSFDATAASPQFQMRETSVGTSWNLFYDLAADTWMTGGPGENVTFNSFVKIDVSGASLTPTAQLHLGTASGGAGQGQLKFSGPSILAVPEQGVMEFNNTNLFFTRVATRENVLIGNAGAAAPALVAAAAAAQVYGVANGNYLGDPNNWTQVNIGGVNFRIPLYT